MIDTRDFLDAVSGYANSGTGGPQSSTDRPVKLGTIDPLYTSGLARILFDGETTTSVKGYSWVNSYSPVGGDRVVLVPVGQSYIIGGKMSFSVDYSRYLDLSMINDWGNFVDLSFHTPTFTKTESGVVKLTGMTAGGLASTNVIICTLPVGFRPKKTMVFPTLNSGNVAGAMRISSDGYVVIAGYSSSTWISLANIVFPTEDLVWYDVTLLNSFTAPADTLIGSPQFAKDSLGRVWLRGGVGRASAPAADTIMFNIPGPHRPQYQMHLPVTSLGNGARSTALIDVMPNGDVRFKQDTSSMTTIAFGGVHFMEASVGGWTNATFQNGWTNNDATAQGPARYRKDADGIVHVAGLVKSGSIPASIFTLPAGMRPAKTIIRYTQALNSTARIEIRADGTFVAIAGSSTWFSLDEVSFTAEQ